MLSKNSFIKGMQLLKYTYVGSDFDITNKDLLNAWYFQFQDMSNDAFTELVRIYVTTKQYAPRSPVELKQALFDEKCSNAGALMDRIGEYIDRIDGFYSKRIQAELPSRILREFGRAPFETWMAVGQRILCEFPNTNAMRSIWCDEYPKHKEAMLMDLEKKGGIGYGKPEAIGDSRPREIPGSKG